MIRQLSLQIPVTLGSLFNFCIICLRLLLLLCGHLVSINVSVEYLPITYAQVGSLSARSYCNLSLPLQ